MTAQAGIVEDEIILMRGLRFRFRDWAGPSLEAPVLLVLHGLGGCSHGYDDLAERLTASHRVIVPDLRGFGQTDWDPEHRYSHDDMADDVTALPGALGLTRFALLGHSMGGLVALTYAGRRPVELSSLIMLDMHPAHVPPELPEADLPPPPARSYETLAAAGETLMPDASKESRAGINRLMMRREDGRWVLRCDPAQLDGTVDRNALRVPPEVEWERYCAIDVPTLLIRGGESYITREGFDEALARNPHARFVEIPGAGHSVPRDAPVVLAAEVSDFLAVNP